MCPALGVAVSHTLGSTVCPVWGYHVPCQWGPCICLGGHNAPCPGWGDSVSFPEAPARLALGGKGQ